MSKGYVGRSHAIAAIALAALLCALALALSPAHADDVPCTVSNTGTSGHDHLCGTSGADTMDGGGGPDRMRGLGGNDTMTGNSGDDDLFGGTGNDTIVGATGSDALDGEDGNDVLTPGSGVDRKTSGGSGDDELRLRDGLPDLGPFDCGPGTDLVDLDLTDGIVGVAIFGSCERVLTGAVDEGPNVAISDRTRRVEDGRRVKVRLRCPAALADPCAGKLTIGRTASSQGPAKRYGIDPGDSEKVPAKLSRRDRRKLHRRGRISVRAISVEAGEFGDKTTVQKLTLIERR